MQETITISDTLKKEIFEGLTSTRKYIPSKYFYDDEGSRLFQEIMRMPEYYLTDCEYEIFDTYKQEILTELYRNNEAFDLVELGAGDGTKTKVLLAHFLENNSSCRYVPVDISRDALEKLVAMMSEAFPDLDIREMAGDYFEVLGSLKICETCRKVALFLGSNIGNYSMEEARDFFVHLGSELNPGDMVLSGFDLIKDPEIILNAYNDPQGYTRDFNLNLLDRANRELGADFDRSKFRHYPVYDPHNYSARSFLISLEEQDVYVREFDQRIHFEKWERIFTEMSRKFSPSMIEQLAAESGYEVVRNFYDEKKYFVDSLWVKK